MVISRSVAAIPPVKATPAKPQEKSLGWSA